MRTEVSDAVNYVKIKRCYVKIDFQVQISRLCAPWQVDEVHMFNGHLGRDKGRQKIRSKSNILPRDNEKPRGQEY